ncbi:MAG: beta-Ig-H3/fasciclin [Anaerolineaceae bacterium]|nr:beta-Ig-H3/fasciclin [Anaerolineaceae bacterium]
MKRVVGILFVLLLLAFPTFAQDQTIADIVVASAEAEDAEFTTLLAAVSAADASILEALADPEAELTVFAPTDAAFAALVEALGEEAFNEILTEEDTPRLNEILLYHVLPGIVPSADVVAGLEGAEADDMGAVSFPVVTLSGQSFDVAGSLAEEGSVDLEAGITVAEANLVLDMIDIEASNGVVHVIDAVIVPELRTIADIVVESTEADSPEFTTLLTAVGAADPAVLELLSDPAADITVFAPTDAAFADVEGLDDIVADTALLTTILQYHVFAGSVFSFQLGDLVDDMGDAVVEMANGSNATITVDDMGVTINDANIIAVDIEAINGVIHVIDGVIVPPTE